MASEIERLLQQADAYNQRLDKKKKKGFLLDQVSTAGGIGGSLGGAALGASLGSVVPVVGTAAGGILGALLGGTFGGGAGEAVENVATGDDLFKNVGQEATLNGLFGAGPIRLASLAGRTASGLAKGAGKNVVKEAGEKALTDTPIRNALGLGRSTTAGGDVLKTSAQGKINSSADRALLSQYPTVPKRIADEAKPMETVRELSAMGLTKPADVERVANAVTGVDGILNKAVVKATGNARNVDTSTLRRTLDDALDNSGVVDTDRASVKKFFEAQLKMLSGGAKGSLNPRANPSDALQVMKKLEGRITQLKRTSGTVPGRADQADALQLVKDELEEALFAGAGANANVAGLLTPELRQQLVSLAPKNNAWVSHIDNNVMTATDVPALRSAQRALTRGKKIIEAGDDNALTFGGRGGQAFSQGGIKEALLEAGANTVKNPAARAYAATTKGVSNLTAPRTGNPLGALPTAGRVGIAGALTGSEGQPAMQDPQMAQTPGLDALDAQTGATQAVEPSIGGVTKSQLEQAMAMAAMDGNDGAFSDLKKLHDMLEASGPGNLSSTAAGQVASSDNALNTLNQLDGLFSNAGGGSNVVQGNIQNALGGLGIDSNAKIYNDLAASSVSQLARAINGGGQVSDADAAVVVQALPRLTDSKEVAAAKIAALRQRLSTARDNTLTYSGGGN